MRKNSHEILNTRSLNSYNFVGTIKNLHLNNSDNNIVISINV